MRKKPRKRVPVNFGAVAPGEPIYAIRGQDPLAPDLLLMICALRSHDCASAAYWFSRLVDKAERMMPADPRDLLYLSDTCKAMIAWQEKRGG